MNYRVSILTCLSLTAVLAGCGPQLDDPEKLGTQLIEGQGPSGVSKIYGGSAPTAARHDSVVALHDRTSSGSVYTTPFCSGNLIDDDVVLTAGHCVTTGSGGVSSAGSIAVYVGDDPSVDLSAHVYTVSEVSRHPSYSASSLTNDIALLRLSSPITEGYAPVAALPASLALSSSDVGATINFSGFGYQESGAYGEKLQVDVALAGLGCAVSGCPSSGSSTTQYSYSQTGGEGPCSGDSGGPGFIQRSGTWYNAGPTSYGDAACTRYGVSTRADAYESYIADFIAAGSGGDDTGDGGGTASCSGFDATYEGNLTGTGDSNYEPGGTYYTTTASGYHDASLSGPSSADFDLYLYKYNSRSRRWSNVASSTGSTSDEAISYYGSRATYMYVVYSYSGSGDYTLCLSAP